MDTQSQQRNAVATALQRIEGELEENLRKIGQVNDDLGDAEGLRKTADDLNRRKLKLQEQRKKLQQESRGLRMALETIERYHALGSELKEVLAAVTSE